MRQVIIGTGAAGISAAKTIRGISAEDDIIMISEDAVIQSRCMLHRYISGERNEETISFVDDDFFQDNRISWIGGERVQKIDPAAKTIFLNGEKITYDNLLIATGADSVIPPIGMLHMANNVFGLRHLRDAKAITKQAESSEKVLVIGSGLVGLDAAYALLALGKEVHVVEMSERILTLNLDAHSAAAYQRLFEENGCTFHLGKQVKNTIMNEQDNIKGVELSDGEVIVCDMVVVAVGASPATDFLHEGFAKANRGLKVDDFLQTNVPCVFAAGDVTGLSGIWPNAANQGIIAGKNMCGQQTRYADTYSAKNTINFFGLLTMTIGNYHTEEGDIVEIREDKKRYQKILLRENKVAGVILQGNIDSGGFWQYLIKNQVDLQDLQKSIWKISYADFFALDEKGQYMWRVQ